MRCFLPCFSASKRQNHFTAKPAVNANDSIQPNPVLEESIHWISSESKEKATNTKENNQEQECSDSLFSVSIGGKPVSAEQNVGEIEVNSTPMKLQPAKEVSGLSTPIVPVKEPEPEPEQNSKEEDRRVNQSLLEYRYRDCYDDDDDGYDDINLDDDDSHNEKTEQGSSESSLFSISTDFSNRKRISFSSTEKLDNEVTSKMVALQEDDNEVLSVLNPIENVQGKVKEVKATVLNPIKKDKENINRGEEKTRLKVSSSSIGVDTSLSDWLVESENKDDIGKRGDVEDRPILRALTVEEIRKCSSVSKTSNKCVKVSSGYYVSPKL